MSRLPTLPRFAGQVKACPVCEGKGVCGQLAHGEEPEFITLLGHKIQVIGSMLDVPCKYCEGRGYVPRDLSQQDRWAQLAAKRKSNKTGGPDD